MSQNCEAFTASQNRTNHCKIEVSVGKTTEKTCGKMSDYEDGTEVTGQDGQQFQSAMPVATQTNGIFSSCIKPSSLLGTQIDLDIAAKSLPLQF